ncbi:flagellar biosynthetic protein FliR [Paracoccus saliphilus]|uniref:Flagellar biosynthetic protein FliR n=1 Tax=Paracoccus saliphilus TaxID=405559 RepID=A0AA45W6F9_9RHOB|nr:flagellar biosynthetic protein FliR [Paracoccus saliphilus]WCR04414.1 flagellar biosynthetic protein FliR [Paracoccus saliphilus]SIT01682.1 flagellar biosynthetic protein FliR [Paracoccus saliphilus]
MWDQLTTLLPGLSWAMVLVYARVQATILILPALGERNIPARVRVAVAMAVTPLLAAIVPAVPIPQTPLEIAAQIAAEMAIGFASGALLRILAGAIDIATTAIAATASLSQIVGVPNEAAPHPLGNLLHLGGIAILMAMGLPIMLLRFIADGLTLWPPAGWPDAAMLAHEAIRIFARGFGLALVLAAPFTLGGFMFQALSGVINRVMPALPVVFIGSPASILLALAGAALLGPLLVDLWANAVLDYSLPDPG